MTPFVIFAIVLTVLYVLYYTIIITMDVLVKPNTEKATEEVIEIDSDDEVASVIVSDSSDDFTEVNTVEKQIDEEVQQKEISHRFDVAILNKMSDIELSFSDACVSEDLKYDRMIAMGVSLGTVIEETNTEEEDNDDEREEDDTVDNVDEYLHVNAEDRL